MTAVVGILNKQAVAIAADSAVTIDNGNGHKILNKENKVFALSKHHPVGIMIYNSADFMGTPWETIIKVYRQQLGDRSFPLLKDYQNDFLDFLRKRDFFASQESQAAYLGKLVGLLINSTINELVTVNRHLVNNPTEDQRHEFLNLFDDELANQTLQWGKMPKCIELQDYAFDEFEREAKRTLDTLIDLRFTKNGYGLSAATIDRMNHAVWEFVKTCENWTNFTGLVFVGFGEDEIYPQLVPINISGVVGNRIRYYVDTAFSASISNENNAAVCPFAQTDVIDTILAGSDPSLDDVYKRNFASFIQQYNNQILGIIGNADPKLTEQIVNLDPRPIVNALTDEIDKAVRELYISPLMSAVSTLSKDDLAEMAESLIYLTYLKRRITFAEESVGGPVDVAVISKGDGFIWIKRKQYFRSELNQHFFDNYLR